MFWRAVFRSLLNAFRITVQLIDALKDITFGGEVRSPSQGHLCFTGEITMKIITALQVEVEAGRDGSSDGKGANNIDAYIKSLQASELIAGDQGGLAQARSSLRKRFPGPTYYRSYVFMSMVHHYDICLVHEIPEQSLPRLRTRRKAFPWTIQVPPHSALGKLRWPSNMIRLLRV